MENNPIVTLGAIMGLLVLVIVTVGGGLYGCPVYNVYSAKMSGEAELAQASQNRQVLVQTAEAQKEAEVLRAEGTAQANKIIGDSLKDNPDYLRWLWVNKIDDQSGRTVIYVPTDGMIPQPAQLETGRAAKQP